MKIFRKTIVVLLLMTIVLLPAAGLGESAPESTLESAFETLRTLIEEPQSEDIPAVTGTSLYAKVVDAEAAAGKGSNPTPDGIICQIYFEDEYKIIISAINDVAVEKEAADEEAGGEETGEEAEGEENIFDDISDEPDFEVKYEAVVYSGLTMEQMLYYAYLISSNYNTIQSQMPYGLTFSIIVKYGKNVVLLINNAEDAVKLTETVVETVSALTGE